MELNKYIGGQIKKLRENRGLNQEQFADVLETTKQTVSRYEKGDRKTSQDTLFLLSRKFNVELDYFFPPIDEVVKREYEPNFKYHYFDTPISAGAPDRVDGLTHTDTIELPDNLMGRYAGQRDIFITRVNGESMNRIIPDGSLIAVKPVEIHQIKDGDVIVYSDGGDYSVKRFYKRDDQLIFKPDSKNESFYDYITTIENTDLKIHGKVVIYIVELD